MPPSQSITVTIRIRPPSPNELSTADPTVVHCNGNVLTCVTGEGRPDLECEYGSVLGEESSQDECFETVEPTVAGIATGINGCIFTYGQTGAGKTYTMLGSEKSSTDGGLTDRAIAKLFSDLDASVAAGASSNEEIKYSVHCSFLQIYNEKLIDLLGSSENLAIRENKGSGSGKNSKSEVFVSGLSEYRVTRKEDVMTLIAAGTRARMVRGTEMNDVSSRSHAVLQLSVESEATSADFRVLKRSKLSLVDLAGSEKMQAKAMAKQHTKELTSINTSLSALGNVMSALSNSKRSHIPYRDSKLTRLLQDSLGGNTMTAVICCVSPCQSSVEETAGTLKFADRARRVLLHVRRNEVIDDKVLLARAQSEIARLRTLLKMYMGQDGNSNNAGMEGSPTKMPRGGVGMGAAGMAVEDLVQENARLMEQNRALSAALKKNNYLGPREGAREETGGEMREEGKESAFRRKKRLPENNSVYNQRTSKQHSRSHQQGEGSESESDTDVTQMRRDLQRKAKAKKNAAPNLGGTLAQIEEEHRQADMDRERIRKEREELEAQLAAVMAGSAIHDEGLEDSMFANDDADEEERPEIEQSNDSYADDGFEAEEEKKSDTVVLGVMNFSSNVASSPKKKEGGGEEKKKKKSPNMMRTHSPINTGAGGKKEPAPIGKEPAQMQSRTQPLPKPCKPKRDRIRKKDIDRKQLMAVDKAGVSKSAAELPVTLGYSMADLGARVAIYSFRYDFYYPSTIVGYDHRRNMHCVLYDDGGESGINGRQWYDLRTKKIKRVEVMEEGTGARRKGAGKGRKGGGKKGAAEGAREARESATAPV